MSYDDIKSIAVLLAVLITAGAFALRLYRIFLVNLRNGKPSGSFGNWPRRIGGLFVYVGGQVRLFRFPGPGTRHFFIFWGFVTLSPTLLGAVMEGLMSFVDPGYALPLVGRFGPLALLQDIFIVLLMIALLSGLRVRLITKPYRYVGSHKKQAVMVLAGIFTIMVTLLLMNGARINLGEDPIQNWRPISSAVGGLFAALDERAQVVIEEASYWLHLAIILLFVVEVPGGKHFHVFTSLPAILLRNLEPPGRLPPATQHNGSVGVGVFSDFRWRLMLDFYTCTECGRCLDVCPCEAPGSPKALIMNLREGLKEHGLAARSGSLNGASQEDLIKGMVSRVVSEEGLWACGTCYACDQECPLFIEHVVPIVDMRRYLVSEGRVEGELQGALANLGRYGNSFGQSPRARARWTQTIRPKVKDARRVAVEYLWFVGDYASYNPGIQAITAMTAEVLEAAGLDFGILYESERNGGNDVRRVGEEGLFEMLVEKNAKALGKCSFEAIVTTDPHSYNVLKNEYPADIIGGRPILHYAELLDHLIASNKLVLSKQLDYRVTYHDPCYLGRYNGVYDAPRRVIEATGCQLVEMPRHRDRALCCGAGGGRIWMNGSQPGERPSEARVREAAALDGVSALVVTCPKDMAMYRDAVKTTGVEGRLVVTELIELVHKTLDNTP